MTNFWSFSFSISPSSEYSGLISLQIDWFDCLAVQGTFRSLLQHHSSKALSLWCSAFFTGQLSQLCMTPGMTIALTIWTFVDRVMSLFFNTLSRFVITFLPRSNHLLTSWLQSPSLVILEPKKRKSVTTSTFPPSICHSVMRPDSMSLVFFKYLVLSRLFHSSPSASSRGSLVPFRFQPLESYHLHIRVCWYFSRLSWFQLVTHPAQHFSWWHRIDLTNRGTADSPVTLLSQPWTNQLFHTGF